MKKTMETDERILRNRKKKRAGQEKKRQINCKKMADKLKKDGK